MRLWFKSHSDIGRWNGDWECTLWHWAYLASWEQCWLSLHKKWSCNDDDICMYIILSHFCHKHNNFANSRIIWKVVRRKFSCIIVHVDTDNNYHNNNIIVIAWAYHWSSLQSQARNRPLISISASQLLSRSITLVSRYQTIYSWRYVFSHTN